MATIGEIEAALWELAPRELAQAWDNVGLLVGDPARETGRVLVALDVTPGVVREARERRCGLIVAHHPVMNVRWHEREMQTLRPDTRLGALLTTLVREDVAAICMHTNLDAAAGGVNDALAAALGLEETAPLSVEDGIGRVGVLPRPMAPEAFLSHVAAALRPNGLRWTDGGRREIRRVAVGGGSCGGYAGLALAAGCDAFVTADLKYDQFLDAAGQGLTLVDAGHFPTENVVCPVVAEYLSRRFPRLETILSSSHREVIQYYNV